MSREKENNSNDNVYTTPSVQTPATQNTCQLEVRNHLVKRVVNEYLDTLSVDNPPSPDEIEFEIVNRVQAEIDLENSIRPKGQKLDRYKELGPSQIGDIILRLYRVAKVTTAGLAMDSTNDILCIYQTEGDQAGLYVNDDDAFNRLSREFNYNISAKGLAEVRAYINDFAPRVMRCTEQNLIAVNNGLFNYETKELLPFTPDKVFLAKSHVNYNPNAKNVVIHNDADGTDWDVESWMNNVSDDPQIVNTLWQVIGAVLRPNVPWGKSAWFYANTGNNGKGTLCELMRQLCGEGTYASITLDNMGKDFMLEPLIHASAIIVDENDVGAYIDKAANLKAIITHDVVTINRKFKTPISYKFRGFMVQCLNEMPKIKDKSDSFYRRQLFIPFEKCFTGAERKYIKNDYLHRQEVLEYVLYKVMNMDYYELSVPDVCKQALDDYKEFNDDVRQFMSEIFPQLQWDLVPFQFLYDLYGKWHSRNFVGIKDMKSRGTFKATMLTILKTDYPDWKCIDDKKIFKPAHKMDAPEPLIDEFGLVDWMNPMYINSKDENKRCTTPLKTGYKGIIFVGDRSKCNTVAEDIDDSVSGLGDAGGTEK